MGDSKSLTTPDGIVDKLTKREYFAALCLVGLLSNEGAVGKWPGKDTTPSQESIRRQDARRACDYADALIEALNEEAPGNAD